MNLLPFVASCLRVKIKGFILNTGFACVPRFGNSRIRETFWQLFFHPLFVSAAEMKSSILRKIMNDDKLVAIRAPLFMEA